MKKALSILMSILIIALSFTFIVGAKGHDCKDHKPNEACHCCIDCPNLDEHYLTACAKKYDAEGNLIKDQRCCIECTGIIPCFCGCSCCPTDPDVAPDNSGSGIIGGGPILNPDQQEEVIDGFQAVMLRVREFFDKLFDAIFEFLRFDEIMGNN